MAPLLIETFHMTPYLQKSAQRSQRRSPDKTREKKEKEKDKKKKKIRIGAISTVRPWLRQSELMTKIYTLLMIAEKRQYRPKMFPHRSLKIHFLLHWSYYYYLPCLWYMSAPRLPIESPIKSFTCNQQPSAASLQDKQMYIIPYSMLQLYTYGRHIHLLSILRTRIGGEFIM